MSGSHWSTALKMRKSPLPMGSSYSELWSGSSHIVGEIESRCVSLKFHFSGYLRGSQHFKLCVRRTFNQYPSFEFKHYRVQAWKIRGRYHLFLFELEQVHYQNVWPVVSLSQQYSQSHLDFLIFRASYSQILVLLARLFHLLSFSWTPILIRTLGRSLPMNLPSWESSMLLIC